MIEEDKKRKVLLEFKNFIKTNNIKVEAKERRVMWVFIEDEFVCGVSEINPKQVEVFCEHPEMYKEED